MCDYFVSQGVAVHSIAPSGILAEVNTNVSSPELLIPLNLFPVFFFFFLDDQDICPSQVFWPFSLFCVISSRAVITSSNVSLSLRRSVSQMAGRPG